ncbi:MAG: hypothetical protein DRP32_00745 [Thermotogae bacterium]|nr:hypothetical protein [Kosmotoga sp.]RKX51104.1 MAG: hypothetical protein DRP32_00745 [Thermotogota bacterium]
MAMVNLHSKKRKVRLLYLLFFLIFVLAIAMLGNVLVMKAFHSRMKQLEIVKGPLFEQLNISLRGIPGIDAETISEKKNVLIIQEAKLARQLKELDKYLAEKRKEIKFFNDLQETLETSTAEKKLITKIEYNAEKSSVLYYLIYDNEKATPPSVKVPEGYLLSIIGKMNFSNLYKLSLMKLESGE